MKIGDTVVVTLKNHKIVGKYLDCVIDNCDNPNPQIRISTVGWIRRAEMESFALATESDIMLWKLENA